MPKAKENDNVKVHYTCSLHDGTIVGGTMNEVPLQFTIGQNKVVPGFEEAVIGMEVGEERDVILPPETTFGPHRENLIRVMDKNILPSYQQIEAGITLQTKDKDGQTVMLKVVDSDEKTVTIDLNHPLAGKELSFHINLVAIS
jgi:FKBP-type peptidyl-prolyl cis-trans isomerase 2